VKRYAFSRRTRFRFVYQDGSEAGDFEIARPGPSGDLIATSLDHGAERIFTLAELRQAIAEQRLRFHLEGRHAQPATCGTPSISPREPDFSEPCISCSGTLAVWPSLLISPAVEAAEEAVEQSLALADGMGRVEDYASRSKSTATIKAYASGCAIFSVFVKYAA
jgi:hypothetical protein